MSHNTEKKEIYRLQKALNQAESYLDIAKAEINRQKAKIERLQRHNKEYSFCNLLGNVLVYSKNLKDYNDMRKGLKAEAYKEFAEKGKSKFDDIARVDFEGIPYFLSVKPFLTTS